MKKFSVLCFLGLILYTSYLDLTKGTYFSKDIHNNKRTNIAYEEIVVQQGETVLSVLERINGTLPVPIEDAMNDFSSLNPNIDPMFIKAGKKYKFPIYYNK